MKPAVPKPGRRDPRNRAGAEGGPPTGGSALQGPRPDQPQASPPPSGMAGTREGEAKAAGPGPSDRFIAPGGQLGLLVTLPTSTLPAHPSLAYLTH